MEALTIFKIYLKYTLFFAFVTEGLEKLSNRRAGFQYSKKYFYQVFVPLFGKALNKKLKC